MKTKDILIAGFLVLLLAGLGYLWLSPSGLQAAPEVTLKIVDGRQISLKALHGRPVLLTFWATSCPSCIKEIPHLVELHNELGPRGLEVIGIAMAYDPPNHVMQMREDRNISYPVALDIDGVAARRFGDVRLTPTSFLIDTRGRIVHHKIGELDMPGVRNRIIAMLNGPAG